MWPSLRRILADSHVATVAIVVLLFWALDSAFWALWSPVSPAVSLLLASGLEFDLRDSFRTLTAIDRFTLFLAFLHFFSSLAYLVVARLLSEWVYGRARFRV